MKVTHSHLDVWMIYAVQSAQRPKCVRPIGGSWSWTIQIKVGLNAHHLKKGRGGLDSDEVKKWQHLCMRVHAGGSPYLAAKINEAKDLLDKEMRRWAAPSTVHQLVWHQPRTSAPSSSAPCQSINSGSWTKIFSFWQQFTWIFHAHIKYIHPCWHSRGNDMYSPSKTGVYTTRLSGEIYLCVHMLLY